MVLDKEKILSLIEEGYLMVNDHPKLPLRIYNYTRKAQFEKYWSEYTLMCRGLILDYDYNVIAVPFKKFKNYEEYKLEEIPNTKFEVFDKMDGSLGIVFFYNNEWHIATRCSFVSDQTVKAKEIAKKYDFTILNKSYTYLFEIIYKENRIVCQYDDEKLVLLGVIHTITGDEMTYSMIEKLYGNNFDIVKKYDGVNDIKELKSRNLPNQEGYVLRYENGFRMKVKFEEYCRLHSIVTNVSAKDIWECLRDGRDLDELLDRTPDEFYKWVRGQVKLLKNEYLEIEQNCKKLFDSIYFTNMIKKDFAMKVLGINESAILFKMFEGKSYDYIIWKMIEPEFSRPFWNKTGDDE
jgi:RNA ligase